MKECVLFLVPKEYKGDLVRTLVHEESPLKEIPDFDPMSKDHFRRSTIGEQSYSPVDCFIK